MKQGEPIQSYLEYTPWTVQNQCENYFRGYKIVLFHSVVPLTINRNTFSSHWHVKLGYNDNFRLKYNSSVRSGCFTREHRSFFLTILGAEVM